jgi:hypothetical protein
MKQLAILLFSLLIWENAYTQIGMDYDDFNSNSSTWVISKIIKQRRVGRDSSELEIRIYHLNCRQVQGSPDGFKGIVLDSAGYQLNSQNFVSIRLKKGVHILSVEFKNDILLLPLKPVRLKFKRQRKYVMDIYLATKRPPGQ